jgi:hypothetical protein
MIIRITELEVLAQSGELTIGTFLRVLAAAAKAGAFQGVKDALGRIRMEVRVKDVARIAFALVMPIVLPLPADARIGQQGGTILVRVRRAQLTAMADVIQHEAVRSTGR